MGGLCDWHDEKDGDAKQSDNRPHEVASLPLVMHHRAHRGQNGCGPEERQSKPCQRPEQLWIQDQTCFSGGDESADAESAITELLRIKQGLLQNGMRATRLSPWIGLTLR